MGVFTRSRGQAELFRGVLARRERRLGRRDTESPSKREGRVVEILSDPRPHRYEALEESYTKRTIFFVYDQQDSPLRILPHLCVCSGGVISTPGMRSFPDSCNSETRVFRASRFVRLLSLAFVAYLMCINTPDLREIVPAVLRG